MSFRNAFGIYHVLERLLKQSPEPLTCVDLYDSPEVKKFADDANRVSDYLGHMYRRGLLTRVNAPRTEHSMARFAYSWKDAKVGTPVQRAAQPRLEVVREPVAATPATLLKKPNIEITESGGLVVIDLPQLTITIKTK